MRTKQDRADPGGEAGHDIGEVKRCDRDDRSKKNHEEAEPREFQVDGSDRHLHGSKIAGNGSGEERDRNGDEEERESG